MEHRSRPWWAGIAVILALVGSMALVSEVIHAGQKPTAGERPPQEGEGRRPTTLLPDPLIQMMIDQVTTEQVYQYDRELAGELPVWVDGGWYTITTRYTYSGEPIQKATHYVGQHMADLGLNVEYHIWDDASNPNVIGEMPGQVNPGDIYIIGGHLDAANGTPGADDDASGSVGTLLAADILTQYDWGCTLRFALWTGEEQWMLGSEAYAHRSWQMGENILGYLNLDMIAWNTPGSAPDIDLLYRPSMPETLEMAELFADAIDAYDLDLIAGLRPDAGQGSDQEPFWDYGYTAILAIEDFNDFNPYYHQPGDTSLHTDPAYFTDLAKAAIATFAHHSGCLIAGGLGTLNGHVTDSGGGAIGGATVTAEDELGRSFPAGTDASGYYSRTLLHGTYTVTAAAYGYLPATVNGVVVTTDTVTTRDFSLEPAPVYSVSGHVTDATTGRPLLAELEFKGSPVTTWTDPATGYYAVSLPQGAYTVEVRAAQHHSQSRAIIVDGHQTQNFGLQPLACILLVDDDNNGPDVQPLYTAALDALGLDYDVFDVGGGTGSGPTAEEMEGRSMVVWFSGGKYNGAGPDATDETNLAAYLEDGGRLFLSSQDYLYDNGLTSFGSTYLGIGSYVEDAGNATAKHGVAADPIGDGLGPYPLAYPPGFYDYADLVNPGAGASVAFRSQAVGGNNLDVDKASGAWKTVFFGTDWATIAYSNAANGQQVLSRIVDWFGNCCPSVRDAAVSWEPDHPLPGEVVTFTAVATGGQPITFEWALGDGQLGHGTPVTHVYALPGDYTVILTATNDCSGQVVTETVSVGPCEPVAGLTVGWQPPRPGPGQTITFTAEAAGSEPVSYLWEFGDGDSGSGAVVSHAYAVTGTYGVSVTASNACGQQQAEAEVEVTWRRYAVYLPLVSK